MSQEGTAALQRIHKCGFKKLISKEAGLKNTESSLFRQNDHDFNQAFTKKKVNFNFLPQSERQENVDDLFKTAARRED